MDLGGRYMYKYDKNNNNNDDRMLCIITTPVISKFNVKMNRNLLVFIIRYFIY